MEVTGTNKSIYFDAETHKQATKVMELMEIDSLSQMIRDLVREKYVELTTKKTVKTTK